MTALSHAAADTATMLRRQLTHQRRYPSLTIMVIGMPVVFLLLFVFVLGQTLGDGLGGPTGGRGAYLDYVTPAVLVITIASAVQATAISVAMDMTEGIVNRFRTMAVARGSILAGHVLASGLQTLLALATVLGVAVAIGYRPAADAAGWLGLLGVLALVSLALIWLTVAAGITATSVETASNAPLPLLLMPFLGSGFVPTESMPAALRWFAEYQPFTPWIETVRGLLDGTGVAGADLALTLAWAVALGLFGYAVSLARLRRR